MRVQGNDIIRDAATELGLPWSDSTVAYTSTDTNVRQLLAFANAAGQDLVREYNWTALQKRLSIQLLPDVTSYPLPVDFLRPIQDSLWGKNTWNQGYGSPTPAQWESLLAWQPASTLRIVFRIQGENLEILPHSSGASTLTLAYVSCWWAGSNGLPLSSESFAAGTPETVFDRRVMVAATKVRYLEDRGFSSVAARADYERAVSRAMGGDGAAPSLTVGGGRSRSPLNWWGLPPTGWGQ